MFPPPPSSESESRLPDYVRDLHLFGLEPPAAQPKVDPPEPPRSDLGSVASFAEPVPQLVASPPSPSLDAQLIELVEQLGIGLIKVNSALMSAENDAGRRLLEAIGGEALLRTKLDQAGAAGNQLREIVTPAPENRHIAVTLLHRQEYDLVALQDHTEERLLQERLLQSEKMASVGQLVSGVAHELNNPLTGVMGFAQLLLARDLDESIRTPLQTIYGEAERAAKIVQNLLSFARRRKPAKEMADVNSLIQRVLELRSYDFAIRNISLDLTLDAHMPRVWADPDQIQQVLFNVTKNAEQAMIDYRNGGKMTVITQATPTGIRLSIADDGPGISAEIQRKIFDPFFTTKDAGQGTGLGLTICYSIIEEHGGRIWTENLTGGGAVFHIDLPLGAPETLAQTPRDDSFMGQAPTSGARRLLIVDDEESIRLLLHDILRMDSHEVQIARSGLEAAQLVESERFDAVITDYKMPGMDGAAFYRHVRERDPDLARRIIFITGDTVSPDTRAFLQRVDNPVLSKPFKIGALRDALESLLAPT